MWSRATESAADQKLGHSLSLSPSVFQSSLCRERGQSLKKQDNGLLLDASTIVKGNANNKMYEILFHSSFYKVGINTEV